MTDRVERKKIESYMQRWADEVAKIPFEKRFVSLPTMFQIELLLDIRDLLEDIKSAGKNE